MKLSISFLVPAFNEEKNIAATVTSILSALLGDDHDYEIILIDDASRDRTGEIILAMANSDARISAIRNSVNLNMGGAYKRGLTLATKEFVIMVPGDNGFGVDSLRQILRNVGAADILVPYVTNIEQRTPFRAFASRAFTAIINGLFDLKIRYYNGPVVHRTALLKTIYIRTNSFAYQAEALVKMLSSGYSYEECAVQTQSRVGGRSAAMNLKNLVGVFITIVYLLFVVGPRKAFA